VPALRCGGIQKYARRWSGTLKSGIRPWIDEAWEQGLIFTTRQQNWLFRLVLRSIFSLATQPACSESKVYWSFTHLAWRLCRSYLVIA